MDWNCTNILDNILLDSSPEVLGRYPVHGGVNPGMDSRFHDVELTDDVPVLWFRHHHSKRLFRPLMEENTSWKKQNIHNQITFCTISVKYRIRIGYELKTHQWKQITSNTLTTGKKKSPSHNQLIIQFIMNNETIHKQIWSIAGTAPGRSTFCPLN